MRKPFILSMIRLALGLGLASALFWLSCTQKDPIDPGGEVDGDTALLASMSVSPDQILSGGNQALVRVRLISPEGTALAGETVLFSTTYGTITGSAVTDDQGWAQVTLTSGDAAGEATISARYGTQVSSTTKLTIAAANESHITLRLGRSSILASGADTTAVVVTVLGDSAQTVSGAVVTFGASAGSITSTVTTNSAGQAEALYVGPASATDLSAIITANVDTLTITSQVALRGVTLEASANPTAIRADGQSQSIISALIKESSSHIAVANAEVIFSTTLGLIPNSAATSSSGVAQAALTSSVVQGAAQVVARYGNQITDTVSVAFTSSLPTSYVLQAPTVESAHIIANGVAMSAITAKVVDANGEAASGLVVNFATTSGAIASQVVTDASGNATAQLIATASETDITATVTVSLGTQSQTAQVVFDGVEMQVAALPDTILSDGQSQSNLRVVLKRMTSKEAIAGALVRFGATRGTIPAEATTDASGVARVSLTSENQPAQSIVSVRYGLTLTKQDTVVFSQQAAGQYVLSDLTFSASTLLANGTAQSQISALVTNESGQPVSGMTVGFVTTQGSLSAASVVTGSDGLAKTVLTAPALENVNPDPATVTASLNGQQLSGDVVLEGIVMTLNRTPETILANGQSTSEISAVLKRYGTNVAIQGGVIQFGTTLGTIPAQANTDASGVAEVNLTSVNQEGTATVTARYGNLILRTTTVAFEASVPQNLQVTTSPPVITADGQSTSEIRAMVTDANSNPVPNGTVVNFQLTSGTGSLERTKTTVGGLATSTLTAGARPDTAQITVTVGGLSQSVEVVYTVGAASQILVSAAADSIMADGKTNTTITARVLDAQGTPIQGRTVVFSTTIGDVTPSAQTNANGQATAQFSSGSVGAAVITASVSLPTGGSVSGSTTVVAVPGGPNSIVLSFSPTAIGVRETGQNQTTIIEAEVRDARNNPVVDGTEVTFSIVHGPNGGEFLSPGPSEMPIPTVGGIARASLSSGTISGNVRIEARVTATTGQIIAKASEILIHAGPPYMEDADDYASTHLTIAADQLNIWRTLGTTQISIAVFDRYHNPVQQGTAVYLTASGGGVSTHTAYTDDQGKATVILTGANPQPTIDKFYNGDLVQDPNSGVVLPGPVWYPSLGDSLLPNFDGDINGWGEINLPSGVVTNSQGDDVENDGVARIVAYTEGHDLLGNSVRAWDQISVVYSGIVGYADDTASSLANDTLHISEEHTMVFRLMDDNGNPIESNSVISASLTNEVDATLSWTEINTGTGWGRSYYRLAITNSVDPADTDPKVGPTRIKITWNNGHQFGEAVTEYGVVIVGLSGGRP